MKLRKEIEADFVIDKLTNSIENTITGEVFDTEVNRLYLHDSKEALVLVKQYFKDFDHGKF